MLKLLLIVLSLIIPLYSQGSNSSDFEEVDTLRYNSFIGTSFYGDSLITRKVFKSYMKSDTTIYSIYNKGRHQIILANVIAITGCVFFVSAFINAETTGDFDASIALFAISLPLVAVSVPFGISGTRKIKRAVGVYNAKNRSTVGVIFRNQVYGVVYSCSF